MSFIMRPIRFASTGHIIEGSGLFDGSTGFLQRTQTAGNQKTWTFEWVGKRAELGTTCKLIEADHTTGGYSVVLQFQSDDTIYLQINNAATSNATYVTDQVFRDPSAWLHIVWAVDTSQGTAGDRSKLYVNGTQITSFSSSTNPGLNDLTSMNTTDVLSLGYRVDTSTISPTRYTARAILIDGQALDPTSFGEVTDDGFWQINDASGLTFGTNGFLIEGGVNVAAGTDSSSNASTTAVDVTSAASIWDGSTGSFNLANDDIICTGGDKAIFTKTVFTGVVDLEFTGVGEWAEVLFGFSKYTTLNNSGAAAGGVDGVEGISIFEHKSNATKFSDWSNTNAGNGSSPTATITRGQIAGETCNLIRQADGTVIFKIGGSTVFTGSDTYTGPIRVWMGSHGDITPPLSMTTVSITASGTAGNIFRPTGTITATSDSPTNDADNGYGNYATLNPLDLRMSAVAATLSNGNLDIATGGGGGRGSTIMLPSSGKYKVELIPTGTINTSSFGITSSTTNDGNMLRTGAVIKIDGSNSQTGLTAMAVGQVHVMLIDMDAMTVQFKLNNANTGSAAALSADAGLGYMIHTWDSDGNTDWSVNFGQLGFTHEDADYLPLATQNLPEPDVINYEDEYYIEAGISHSNGSTTAVTLPTSVSGGAMARIKRTDSTSDWYIFDTVRGANKSRKWNEAEAEDTSTFDDQNLTGTTLTLPSDLATGTYLVEVFYVGSYFQIQTVTGNAGARTITWPTEMDSYGFSAFFPRTGASSGISHHKDIGAQQILFCDNGSTAANRTNFSQAPNKTDFRTPASVGPDFNLNTIPYVCYGWANSGPYAFGFYNPNNSADGPMINLGGMPATMVVKRNGGSSWNWTLITKVIDTYNEGYQYLEPNTTIAPNTSSTVNEFDLVSNGLKVREAGNNSLNGTPASDIQVYGAFGIQPLTDGAINQGRAK